jgi:hypothetical protein
MGRSLFLFLIFAIWIGAAHAETPSQTFPQSCIKNPAPLKSCLINEIVANLKVGPSSDWQSRSALSTIADVVAEEGNADQRRAMVQSLIGQIKGKSVKTQDELWLVKSVITIVGLYGMPAQIQEAKDINAALPHKLTNISEEDLAKNPFNTTMDGIKRFNELYLDLASDKDKEVVAALKQIAKGNGFTNAIDDPEQNLGTMAQLLLYHGPPERTLQFIQDTHDIHFNIVDGIIGGDFMHFPPSPLERLTLVFLEKGDLASAKLSLDLCENGSAFRFGVDCANRLEFARQISSARTCSNQSRILEDPSFLKWMAEDWAETSPRSKSMFGDNKFQDARETLGAASDCDEAISKLIQTSISSSVAGEKTTEFANFLRQTYGRSGFKRHPDSQQRAELEELWPGYLAGQKLTEAAKSQDEQTTMAGLNYSYRIAKLFTVPASGGLVDEIELGTQYPKAFALLGKIRN